MKKNYFLRAAALLVACCMFGLCTITGTMARYTGKFDASGTAVRAGIFRVIAQDNEGEWIPLGGTSTIDLFKTLQEANIVNDETDVVAAASGETVIIAPGTGGKFDIKVQNLSEVAVKILVTDIGTGTATVPIEWYVGPPGAYGTGAWASAFPGISTGGTLAPQSSETTFTFYWRWAFEVDNPRDTSLGVDAKTAAVTYTLPLKVTAEQLD